MANEPVQYTTADGSLVGAVDGHNNQFSFTPAATESLLFRNGLLMTQPIDGVTAANTAILVPFQTPASTDVVTVRAWTPDPLMPLNQPQQFSSIDGSLAGVLNGVNNLFTLLTGSLVTQIQLFWNGLLMTQGIDYSWTCLQGSSAGPWETTITMMNGQYPHAGNNLTAEVYFS